MHLRFQHQMGYLFKGRELAITEDGMAFPLLIFGI